MDGEGRIAYANGTAEAIFGYPAAAMLGREVTMLIPERLRERHRAGWTRYWETGTRRISWRAVEFTGLRRDGSEVPIEVSFGEFSRGGRRYLTGIIRDVSERKQTEEALRRSREERLAELERVRQRIATDLHDDIGSSLTQISILSEVVQRQSVGAAGNERLATIAQSARELIDSMSDIVWAINPHRDHLSDLTHRMRRFAADTLPARGIRYQMHLPEDEVHVEGNLRRELFLIFKEAVNNIVRHSGCTEARIEMVIQGGWLRLTLCDNGHGFETAGASNGHGLVSMRGRAAGIGADLSVDSAEGAGTTIHVAVPVAQNAIVAPDS
jgi:PAS domain S-box-containing protein